MSYNNDHESSTTSDNTKDPINAKQLEEGITTTADVAEASSPSEQRNTVAIGRSARTTMTTKPKPRKQQQRRILWIYLLLAIVIACALVVGLTIALNKKNKRKSKQTNAIRSDYNLNDINKAGKGETSLDDFDDDDGGGNQTETSSTANGEFTTDETKNETEIVPKSSSSSSSSATTTAADKNSSSSSTTADKNSTTAETAEYTVDYSCTSESDCAVKDVGNCCGTYYLCVNVNFTPNRSLACPDGNGSMYDMCGWRDIDKCICEQGRCEGFQEPLLQEPFEEPFQEPFEEPSQESFEEP
ncbi:hypothetical protein ACA910_008853 [Epithemia clementina (nom. ined.)]